jgi:hypothetical protein
MKNRFHFLTICFLVASIFLIGTGCEDKTNQTSSEGDQSTPPTPEVQWNRWLKLQIELGTFTVLNVSESEKWIEENRSKISMPDTLSFMERHTVMEAPFMQQNTFITVDHNGKYRVVARGFTYPRPPPDPPPGFLSEKESKNWLKSHGYQLVTITDGYTIKKKRPGLDINITLKGSGTALNTLMEDVTVMHQNGKIYISRE